MLDDLTLRDAAVSDVPALLPLLSQLGYPCDRAELEQRFRRFIASPGAGACVAVRAGEVVGVLAWLRWTPLSLGKTKFRLDSLVVDQSCRGRGIGHALMLEFERRCRAAAPAVVELTSGVRRERDGTHRFYRALGYRNEGLMAKLYLRKDID